MLSTTWKYQGFALTGRVNHVSGWRFGDSATRCFSLNAAYIASYGCKISAWTTLDLALGYTGLKNLDVGIGIRNIQDKKSLVDPGSFTLGYNPAHHNPFGRYYTVWLNYKFL